jgi:hypothetical protein
MWCTRFGSAPSSASGGCRRSAPASMEANSSPNQTSLALRAGLRAAGETPSLVEGAERSERKVRQEEVVSVTASRVTFKRRASDLGMRTNGRRRSSLRRTLQRGDVRLSSSTRASTSPRATPFVRAKTSATPWASARCAPGTASDGGALWTRRRCPSTPSSRLFPRMASMVRMKATSLLLRSLPLRSRPRPHPPHCLSA